MDKARRATAAGKGDVVGGLGQVTGAMQEAVAAIRTARELSSVEHAERIARRRLPRVLAQRAITGSPTNQRNQEVFKTVEFLPRAATVYRAVSVKRTVIGSELEAPIVIGPMGQIRLFHPGGDVVLSRAAAAAGIAQAVAMGPSQPIAEIAKAGPGPKWQLLTMRMGRRGVENIVAESRSAACTAIVVGVDGVTIPRLFTMPKKSFGEAVRYLPQLATHPRWVLGFRQLNFDPRRASGAVDGDPQMAFSPSWDELRWIREIWDGGLVVKGVLRVEDAKRAVDAGADGIVVSNHGGSLPNLAPSLSVLPAIADAVGQQTQVLFDGGIRSGGDIAKAIALGAHAVMVGRAALFGLIAGGEASATRILKLLIDELWDAVMLLGARSLDELDRSFLATMPPVAAYA
jgi:L-lactate dehydrogenase (cytochrome)